MKDAWEGFFLPPHCHSLEKWPASTISSLIFTWSSIHVVLGFMFSKGKWMAVFKGQTGLSNDLLFLILKHQYSGSIVRIFYFNLTFFFSCDKLRYFLSESLKPDSCKSDFMCKVYSYALYSNHIFFKNLIIIVILFYGKN